MIEKLEIDRRERLTRLWLEAESAVRAFVFSAVPGFQDAEDVVQQVALTVARRFDEYDATRPFVAWALWLAKSRIADHHRQRARGIVPISDVALDQIAAVLVERHPDRPRRQVALEECLEKLPEKSRRMLELRYLEDHSIDVVAKAIRTSNGAARVMLFRVRKLLADCIHTRMSSEGSRV